MMDSAVQAYLGFVSMPVVQILCCAVGLLTAVYVGDVLGTPKPLIPYSRVYHATQIAVQVLYAAFILLVFVLCPVQVFTWLFAFFAAVPRM